MIVTSLVLVVISAISLLIGGLFRDDLALIYVSIGTALLAGAFLLVGVLRSGGKPKPARRATLPGEEADGTPATWQGAGWGGAAPPETLARDEGEGVVAPPPAPVTATSQDAPTTDLGRATAPDDAVFAPPAQAAPPPPAPSAPAAPQQPSAAPGWAPPPPPPGPAPKPTPAPRQGGGAAPPPPPPPPPAG